ncbi:hypothetical protein [Ammoniphilus sp. 3BR4]|uniref:hypothetical protein n=1 Tax=Ammoniphilus sp. 3BR4 TaxID=3158265 RepID=UPI0034673C70
MKIKGKLFKKRHYHDLEFKKINCLSFLEIDNVVKVDGDRIKVIPVLSEESAISPNLGVSVEIDGEIEWKQIVTPMGNLISLPMPVLRLENIKKIIE